MKIREFFDKYPVDVEKCGSLAFFKKISETEWVPNDPLAHAAVKAGFDFKEGERLGKGIIPWIVETQGIPRLILRTFMETWDLWYPVGVQDGNRNTIFTQALYEAEKVEKEVND